MGLFVAGSSVLQMGAGLFTRPHPSKLYSPELVSGGGRPEPGAGQRQECRRGRQEGGRREAGGRQEGLGVDLKDKEE